MANILVIYGTKYGHTARIAQVLEQEFKHLKSTVTLANVEKDPINDVGSFDGIVVCAPVYAGKYSKAIQRWISKNSQIISKKTSAFVSVCLGVLEKDNKATQNQERKIVHDLLVCCGWKPHLSRIVPGALLYTKYNWLIRFLMKRIAKKAGGDTDTSRDYEYTDWDEIRRLGREFSSLLATRLSTNNEEFREENYKAR